MENASQPPSKKSEKQGTAHVGKPNQVSTVLLYGIPIVCLFIESQERLCLAQISNTLLKQFSYNEIHNRRVALGITCVQCTPVQLEILRRAGAMPVSSRRCGMITRREAERLCKSFLGDNAPPRLPDDFAFSVFHECAWGCRGSFLPSRYNSSRAKCIKCTYCGLFFSPNKFIFHSHRLGPNDKYVQPDAANFNSWRRHMKLLGGPPDEIAYAWEDVKAMFNGGTRKRMISSPIRSSNASSAASAPKRPKMDSDTNAQNASPMTPAAAPNPPSSSSVPFPVRPIIHPVAAHSNNTPTRFPNDLAALPFPRWMDYMWHAQTKPIHFPPYALPRLKWPLFSAAGSESNNSSANTSPTAATTAPDHQTGKSLQFYNHSAFKPVINSAIKLSALNDTGAATTYISDDEVEISKSSEMDENDAEYKNKAMVKESLSSDDEMVDIETTEDDIEDTRKELQRNCHENFELGKRSVSPPLSQRNHSPAKIRAEYKREQSPVKLHTKYDGNSNVTNASASISITTDNIPLQQSSSPLSQSPRSNTSSSPISSNSHVTVPGELWSVARLSLDRSQDSQQQHQHQHHHIHHSAARLPFYRNDLKHFHAFSHIAGHHNNNNNNNNNSTEATTASATARQGHSHTIA